MNETSLCLDCCKVDNPITTFINCHVRTFWRVDFDEVGAGVFCTVEEETRHTGSHLNHHHFIVSEVSIQLGKYASVTIDSATCTYFNTYLILMSRIVVDNLCVSSNAVPLLEHVLGEVSVNIFLLRFNLLNLCNSPKDVVAIVLVGIARRTCCHVAIVGTDVVVCIAWLVNHIEVFASWCNNPLVLVLFGCAHGPVVRTYEAYVLGAVGEEPTTVFASYEGELSRSFAQHHLCILGVETKIEVRSLLLEGVNCTFFRSVDRSCVVSLDSCVELGKCLLVVSPCEASVFSNVCSLLQSREEGFEC